MKLQEFAFVLLFSRSITLYEFRLPDCFDHFETTHLVLM